MKRLLLSSVAALALSGCNLTTAGIPCDGRGDCEPGQDCLVAPGGFCSKGCAEPGQSRDCPVGTICTSFGANQLVCSPLCQIATDCRVNFECVLTHPTGTVSACQPIK